MDWLFDLEHGIVNLFRVATIVATAIALYASIHVDHPPRHNTIGILFIGGTFCVGAVFGLALAVGLINQTFWIRWVPIVSIMVYVAQITFAVLYVRFANGQRRIAEELKLARRNLARDRISDADLFRIDDEEKRK